VTGLYAHVFEKAPILIVVFGMRVRSKDKTRRRIANAHLHSETAQIGGIDSQRVFDRDFAFGCRRIRGRAK
jgi:hypothetical protein